MVRLLLALIATILVPALVHAQAPKGDGARFDCSQAKDPKAIRGFLEAHRL